MSRAKPFLFDLIILTTLILAALGANFRSVLLYPASRLPGTPEQGAFALLHLWWPAASFGVADDLAVHSFIGGPYLSNHLQTMPLAQSLVFKTLAAVGPVLAFNLLLAASQVASQLTLFWFFARRGAPRPWAALAATAFVLSPWYTGAVARADMIAAGMWLLPLTLILWDRWLVRPSAARAGLVVLAVYLAVLCGVQNLLWITGLCLPYALVSLWQRRRDPEFASAAGGQLAALGLVLLVLCLIYPAPALVRALQGSEPAYAPALAEPVTRSFIGWILRIGPLLFGLAALTALLARPQRKAVAWLGVAAGWAAASFGVLPDPLNIAAGALGLPYRPLAEREFLFGAALFALLVFVMDSWNDSWQAGTRRPAWAAIGLAVLVALPVGDLAALRSATNQDVSVPDVYRQIAAEPEDYLLLEYPFGLVSVADGRTLGQAAFLARYSVWDGKRSMNGLAPFYEPQVFDKAAATSFLFPDSLNAAGLDSAAQALGIAVREWRIGYVIVHPDLLPARVQVTIQALAARSAALCPPIQQDGVIVYRAHWHPYGCPTN